MATEFIARLLITMMVLVIALQALPTIKAETFTVDDDGGWADHSSIQDAINASSDGDTIYVFNGTYLENVLVNKSLSLIGNGSSNTIVNATGSGITLNITADNVNLSHLQITGSGSAYLDSGILLTSVENCTIVNCNISWNGGDGIFLNSSSNFNTVEYNLIGSNTDSGIFQKGSNNNSISNNVVTHNNVGIYLKRDSNTTVIENNSVSSNYFGIYLDASTYNTIKDNNASANSDLGIKLISTFSVKTNYSRSSDNNIIKDNDLTSNGRYGIYLRYIFGPNSISNNNAISNGEYGIYFYEAFRNNVSNNTVCMNSGDGIHINQGGNNIFLHNIVSSNNETGIYSDSSYRNDIGNNTVNSNGIHGIDLDDFSNNNTVSYNEIFNNTDYGCVIADSYDNVIHHNNFLSNGESTSQGYDNNSKNTWDNGTHGNYWSDYNGTDSNGDGIGETEYSIDGSAGAEDRYPLINYTENSAPQKVPELPILPVALAIITLFIAVDRRKRRHT